MFFSKPNTLVYIHRDGVLVAGKRLDQAKLTFSPDLVENLDVVDQGKFVERCEQFFIDNKLAGRRVLIVLDNSVVFRKNIELDESGQPEALTKHFVESMPFEEGQRACLSIRAGSLLQLVATNADLYESVAAALEACRVAKLMGVTPTLAYKQDKLNSSASAMTDTFFKQTPASKQANFMNVESL